MDELFDNDLNTTDGNSGEQPAPVQQNVPPIQQNVPPVQQNNAYYYNGQTENNAPENDGNNDYFKQESYYQTNPLPRKMTSPYEPPQPPQYAQFVPQNLDTAPKHRGGSAVAIVITVVVTALLAASYIFVGSNNSFASVDERPAEETTISDNEKVPDVTEAPAETTPAPVETAEGLSVSSANKPNVDKSLVNSDGSYTAEGVYQAVVPSVVSIRTKLTEDGTRQAAGSGIILTGDGYVLTNEHVIEDALSIRITTYDGVEYSASLVGKDTKTDLAILKITSDKKDFAPAILGNSDELKIGEQVYTIGNSGGIFSNTFTGGYVSGLNRTIQLTENSLEMNYIQTDATINPGNSGGPLVNCYGQIVGINNFKYYGASANCENMTFAISINEAIPIVNDLISTGHVTGRVRIGITYTAVSDETAAEKGLVAGLYIAEVSDDCDISNCDLKAGDIITDINGKKVYNAKTVLEALKGYEVGDTASANVYRKDENGNVQTFKITFTLEEVEE